MVAANPTLYKWVNWQGIWDFLFWMINRVLFRHRRRSNVSTVVKSEVLYRRAPMTQNIDFL